MGRGDCGLREALRLRAETQPDTPPRAAPLPAGQDPASVGCSESEAAWLPGSVLHGCSPPQPRLLRLPGHTVRSPSCRSYGLSVFPILSLDYPELFRPESAAGSDRVGSTPGFTPFAGSSSHSWAPRPDNSKQMLEGTRMPEEKKKVLKGPGGYRERRHWTNSNDFWSCASLLPAPQSKSSLAWMMSWNHLDVLQCPPGIPGPPSLLYRPVFLLTDRQAWQAKPPPLQFFPASQTFQTPKEVTTTEWIDMMILESDTGFDVGKTQGIMGCLGLACLLQEGTSAGFVYGNANQRNISMKSVPYPVGKKGQQEAGA